MATRSRTKKQEDGAAGLEPGDTTIGEQLTAAEIGQRMFEAGKSPAAMRDQLCDDLESDKGVEGLDGDRAASMAAGLRSLAKPTLSDCIDSMTRILADEGSSLFAEKGAFTYRTLKARLTLGGDFTLGEFEDAVQRTDAADKEAAVAMIKNLRDADTTDFGLDDLVEILNVAFEFAEAPVGDGKKPPATRPAALPQLSDFYLDVADEEGEGHMQELKLLRAEKELISQLKRAMAAAESPDAAVELFETGFVAGRMVDGKAPDPVHIRGRSDAGLLATIRYAREKIEAVARLPLSANDRAHREAFIWLSLSNCPTNPMLKFSQEHVKASSDYLIKLYTSYALLQEHLDASHLARKNLAKRAAGSSGGSFDPSRLNSCGGILGMKYQKAGHAAATSPGNCRHTTPYIKAIAIKSLRDGFEGAESVSEDRVKRSEQFVELYTEMLDEIEDEVSIRKVWACGSDGRSECPHAAFRFFKICQILANFMFLQHLQVGMSRRASYITRLNPKALEALIHASLVDCDETPLATPAAHGRGGAGSGGGQAGKAIKKKPTKPKRVAPAKEAWVKAPPSLIAARGRALEEFKKGPLWSDLSAGDKSTVLAIAHGDHSFRFLLKATDPAKRVKQTLRTFRSYAKSWEVPSEHHDPDAGVELVAFGTAQGGAEPQE